MQTEKTGKPSQESQSQAEELVRKAFSLEKTDPSEALARYDKALAESPKYYRALAYKGLFLERLGKQREAKDCFRKISLTDLLVLNVALPTAGWIIGDLIIAVAYLIREATWLASIVGILGLLIALFSFYALKKHGLWALKLFIKRM